MEKRFVNFISDKSESQWAVVIPDGRMVSLFDKNNKWYMDFMTPFNLKTGEILPSDTPLGGDVVNLNWLAGWRPDIGLVNYKELPTVRCFDEYDIFCGEWKVLTSKRLHNIIEEFREHEFEVDGTDVVDLFESWHEGWKTGIRNEELGYHLFCPCGGNPFSVRLSTLHPLCADWQTSYWA